MAELLKSEFDLLSLVMRMDTSTTKASVNCELQTHLDGHRTRPLKWQWEPDVFGIPSRLDRRDRGTRERAFELPTALIEGLRAWLDQEAEPGRPLWLHLAPPKGHLPIVPWERLLVPVLDRPLMRLPDFYVRPPSQTPETLEVVVCGSAPLAKGAFGLAPFVAGVIEAYARAPRKARRIHIFVDAPNHGATRYEAERAVQGTGADLVFYDPEAAAGYDVPDATSRIGDPGGRLTSPWLLWMRDALAGRTVDVVHAIGHGYLWRDAGALAFARSPWHADDPSWARFVSAEELLTFSTQIGAWSNAFSSPPRNFSHTGLRLLCEQIADRRPGPVLLHDPGATSESAGRSDAEGRPRPDTEADADSPPAAERLPSLAAAVEFLYRTSPGQPPVSPELSLWCQPYRVARADDDVTATEGGKAWTKVGPPLERPLPGAREADVAVRTTYRNASDVGRTVPTWVASTERYMEQRSLAVRKRASRSPATALLEGVDSSMLAEALERLGNAVAEGAKSEGSEMAGDHQRREPDGDGGS